MTEVWPRRRRPLELPIVPNNRREVTRPARWRRAVLAVGSALLLAACNTAGPELGPGPIATATLEPLDPDALVWALGAAPSTLDSAALTNDAAGQQVAAQIYDRLVRFRPGSVQLAPGIAGNWEADPSGNVFTFTLREGLRFHDGTPLDAAAVAWNFQRWMDPSHPYHHGEFKAWRDLFGGLSGEKNAQGRPRNLVAKVEALDPQTVRVTLTQPFAPFLHHLALVPFGMASPTAVQAQGPLYGTDGEHLPVGSGPFKAELWLPDGTVRLKRFDEYWGQPAKAPAIQFTAITDPQRRAEAVVAGQVYGAEFPASFPVTGTLASGNIRVLPRPPRANSWLVFNMQREPFDDLRVRQAFDLAIDRTKLARERFGPLAVPANQLVPPGFPGHDDTLPDPVYDPEAAKAKLAEAGVGPFDLNIWVANTARGYLPDPVGTASSLAEMLQAIGIRAAVKSAGMRRFLSDRDRGRYVVWLLGWEAQSGDPDNWWFWHFGPGRQVSEGQYQKPDLAKLLLNAQRMLGTGPRVDLYQQAAQLAAADTPRLYLVHNSPILAVSKRIRRYEPSAIGFDDFAPVSLPPAAEDATAVPVPTGDAPTVTPGTPLPGPMGTHPATEGPPLPGPLGTHPAPTGNGTPGTPPAPAATAAR